VEFEHSELSDVVLKKESDSLESEELEIQKELLLEPIEKGLNYEKLGYGETSLPVDIKYEYEQSDGKSNNSEHKHIATQIEEVDEIIKEQAMANILGVTTSNASIESTERFKYWKLFNNGLAMIKYDLALT